MAGTDWVWGHIAGMPGKGLTLINQSYTDKPFTTFTISKQYVHLKYTSTTTVKSEAGTSKSLKFINKQASNHALWAL